MLLRLFIAVLRCTEEDAKLFLAVLQVAIRILYGDPNLLTNLLLGNHLIHVNEN